MSIFNCYNLVRIQIQTSLPCLAGRLPVLNVAAHFFDIYTTIFFTRETQKTHFCVQEISMMCRIAPLLLLVATIGSLSTAHANLINTTGNLPLIRGVFVTGLNAGGDSIESPSGNIYNAGSAFTTGASDVYINPDGETATVANAESWEFPLFNTMEYTFRPNFDLTYTLPLTGATGDMVEVELLFAELDRGIGSNNRLFDVFINGHLALQNFDVFENAGGLREQAVRVSAFLSPIPSQVVVTFGKVKRKNKPAFSGLAVYTASEPTTTTTTTLAPTTTIATTTTVTTTIAQTTTSASATTTARYRPDFLTCWLISGTGLLCLRQLIALFAAPYSARCLLLCQTLPSSIAHHGLSGPPARPPATTATTSTGIPPTPACLIKHTTAAVTSAAPGARSGKALSTSTRWIWPSRRRSTLWRLSRAVLTSTPRLLRSTRARRTSFCLS